MAGGNKPARIRHKKNRLEAFSDGVFATAITLQCAAALRSPDRRTTLGRPARVS